MNFKLIKLLSISLSVNAMEGDKSVDPVDVNTDDNYNKLINSLNQETLLIMYKIDSCLYSLLIKYLLTDESFTDLNINMEKEILEMIYKTDSVYVFFKKNLFKHISFNNLDPHMKGKIKIFLSENDNKTEIQFNLWDQIKDGEYIKKFAIILKLITGPSSGYKEKQKHISDVYNEIKKLSIEEIVDRYNEMKKLSIEEIKTVYNEIKELSIKEIRDMIYNENQNTVINRLIDSMYNKNQNIIINTIIDTIYLFSNNINESFRDILNVHLDSKYVKEVVKNLYKLINKGSEQKKTLINQNNSTCILLEGLLKNEEKFSKAAFPSEEKFRYGLSGINCAPEKEQKDTIIKCMKGILKDKDNSNSSHF